jgi:heat shock factor-binding protein 1
VTTKYLSPNNLLSSSNPNQSLHSSAEGSGELAAVVDDLLNQLNTKFSTISSELLSKSRHVILIVIQRRADVQLVDDMSRRLDNLEATIQGGEVIKGSGSSK